MKKFFSVFVVLALLLIIAIAVSEFNQSSDLSEQESLASCSFKFELISIHAYRISSNNFYEVCPSKEQAKPLSSDLVQSPGIYEVSFTHHGRDPIAFSVDARTPGLYRFFVPGFDGQQFLVWEPKLGVVPLMKDIGYVYLHGNKDDSLSMEELKVASLNRKLSVTCGKIVKLLIDLLSDFGIDARQALSVTLMEINGLDDGHIMLETKVDGKWVLFDPDSRTVFGDGDNLLGVADLASNFRPLVGVNIMQLGPLSSMDNSGFVDENNVDLLFLEEKSRISPESLSNWYARILGAVGIQVGSAYMFPTAVSTIVEQRIRFFYPTVEFVSLETLRE
jgi:hypothetical protein